jgi:branched-chain amino acid transport system substrate-binding protein
MGDGAVQPKFLSFSIAALLVMCNIDTSYAKVVERQITIGIAGNFSHSSDPTSHPYGQHVLNAAHLAVDDYQHRLQARGLSVKLKEFDYGDTLEKVIVIAENAVKSDALAVVGFIYSSHVLAAADAFSKGSLLLLSPTATADKIDTLGPFIQRTCFSDHAQGTMLARSALKRGIKRVAVISAADCAYCQSLNAAFSDAFLKGGGIRAVDIKILNSDTEFGDVAATLEKLVFDAIFVPNYEVPSSLLASDLIKRGIRPKLWLGGDAWNANGELSTKILKDSHAKALIITQWLPQSSRIKVISFLRRYSARFGREPVDSAALTYDAVSVVLEAAIRDSALTRASLMKSVSRLGRFEGVTGSMKFEQGKSTPQKSPNLLFIEGDKKMPVD